MFETVWPSTKNLIRTEKLSGCVAHIQGQAGEMHVPNHLHIAMNECESNQKLSAQSSTVNYTYSSRELSTKRDQKERQLFYIFNFLFIK